MLCGKTLTALQICLLVSSICTTEILSLNPDPVTGWYSTTEPKPKTSALRVAVNHIKGCAECTNKGLMSGEAVNGINDAEAMQPDQFIEYTYKTEDGNSQRKKIPFQEFEDHCTAQIKHTRSAVSKLWASSDGEVERWKVDKEMENDHEVVAWISNHLGDTHIPNYRDCQKALMFSKSAFGKSKTSHISCNLPQPSF